VSVNVCSVCVNVGVVRVCACVVCVEFGSFCIGKSNTYNNNVLCSSDLVAHVRVHARLKFHPCAHCTKHFTRPEYEHSLCVSVSLL